MGQMGRSHETNVIKQEKNRLNIDQQKQTNHTRTCTVSSIMPSSRSRIRRFRTTTSRHRSSPSWCTVVLHCLQQVGGGKGWREGREGSAVYAAAAALKWQATERGPAWWAPQPSPRQGEHPQ